MDNQSKIVEIQKLMHEKQNRFVYYITGLCVAAIGFSVHQTADDKLTCIHLWLGGALFSWSASMFCCFQFIQIKLNVLYENARSLNIIEQSEDKELAANMVNEHLAEYVGEKSDRTHNNFMWVQYWFYAGMVLFLVWHIIQMYKN